MMKASEFIIEADEEWSSGKHPGDMSEKEFMKHHHTGYIDKEAYSDTTKPGNERWKDQSKRDLPKLIDTQTFNGKNVEFRKSIEENKYVKHDSNGEIVRNEKGLATLMTRNAMRKKGLPLYIQTIFVFHNDEYIGLAGNALGAIGVWIRDDYQGTGIGSHLLKLFMEENPHMQIGQMTDMGYGMARKVWELFYKDKHGVSPEPKLDNSNLREEYKHMDSDLKDVASWMDTTVDNLHIEVDMVPIAHFKKQIEEMHSTYEEYPNDAHRTNKIIQQIKSGATPLPVYIDISDPTGFVMEGRHRMVAFWLLGMKEIPVAYVYNKTKHSKYITDDIDHLPTGGDCFKVAYRLITSGELPNHDLRLVHAITDRIKDHAWVELGDVVIDKSNGNNFVGRKEQYYEHFGVYPNDPTKFRTYNAQEVNEMAITHMTYGPWEL